jgi:hypothetical protein
MSMPPRKAIVFVLLAIAAAAPARNEPSCSRNVTEATFGSSTTASMIAKLRCGKRLATSSTSRAIRKPTAKISSYSLFASTVRFG